MMNKLLQAMLGMERWKKRLLQLAFDVVVIALTFALAFTIRTENLSFIGLLDFYIGYLIILPSAFLVFWKRGLYSTYLRHLSIETAITIALGCISSMAALYLAIFLLALQVPLSAPLTAATFAFVACTGTRYTIRAIAQRRNATHRKNVIIYGAGVAGTQLMNALNRDPNYAVKMFIDDKPDLQGRLLSGIPIESLETASQKISSMHIDTLLLAIPSANELPRRRVSDLLSKHPMKVRTIPSITDLITGEAAITELQEIRIQDLLGRKATQPDAALMSRNITGKTILVTGGAGSIGSELCRQIIQWSPKRLVLFDISEFAVYTLLQELDASEVPVTAEIIPIIGSVQDNIALSNLFSKFDIDTIYHAAAYKHVPLMQQNLQQCIANNVFGTLALVEQSVKAKVENFILVSTDKAVNPSNYMGASKRIAELICQSKVTKNCSTCFAIVRFGNVLGSSGSVVPQFKRQIEKNGPITLTHPDVTRFFMTIPEAAQLVIQAGSISTSGEIFVLDMGHPVKILDLARKMVTLSGFKPMMAEDGDPRSDEISITITGLRDGEKIHEELSYSDELVGTIHPRIMKTKEPLLRPTDLPKHLSAARQAIDTADDEALQKIVSEIVIASPNLP